MYNCYEVTDISVNCTITRNITHQSCGWWSCIWLYD